MVRLFRPILIVVCLLGAAFALAALPIPRALYPPLFNALWPAPVTIALIVLAAALMGAALLGRSDYRRRRTAWLVKLFSFGGQLSAVS